MKFLRALTSGGALMLLAVILGAGTAAAAFVWLDQQAEDEDAVMAASTASGPTRDVVVLLEDVPAGSALPQAALGMRRVPVAEVLGGAAAAIEQVVGRVARYPLLAGEQVTEARLVAPGGPTGNGLAYTVPDGMRAVAVPVNEVSGAGGLIVPGDRVDVMVVTERQRVFGPEAVTAEQADADMQRQPTVVTVLQDVLVLAVGQELADAADSGRDPATLRADDVGPQPRAISVTLAVTPEESQVLFMASQEGPLGFAVRAFGDGTRDALAPVTLVEPALGRPDQVRSGSN
ncbi:MAG: Flp pilus assembly protein CpaB [Dehalococcoidia bacterium]